MADVVKSYPKITQAVGAFLASIIGGLLAYQTPPESWSQFGAWLWQPSLNGAFVALSVLGLNGATGMYKK